MSQQVSTTIAVMGVDIGKNSFHVVGLDQRGAIVLRQRWSRGQVESRLANMPPCLIGMEACVGAHHLSRKLQRLGHDARLMPAKYVRPYSKGQKNDFRDAEAIAEAVQRPTMKFVATKTADQLDLQALHRVRERLVSQRTGILNQIRAFLLERGVPIRQGQRFLRAELPRILTAPPDVLSPRMVRVIEGLTGDWRHLDERIEGLSGEIEAIARRDAGCQRLMSVPGVGPIISSAMVAAIGKGDAFGKGRDFTAWLGLVPRQTLDWGPHDPRQDIEAWQSLPAGPVRPGGMGCADQAQELGPPRAQALARGSQEAAAPQCARHRARQQAGARIAWSVLAHDRNFEARKVPASAQ
jgi:transposase